MIRSLEGKHPGMLVLYLHRIQLNLGTYQAMLSVVRQISLQIWMAAEF